MIDPIPVIPPIPPTVHLVSEVGNIDPQNESPPIGGKGGKEGEGRRELADLKTDDVFLRFFHFARRFWNQTLADKRKTARKL